MCTQMHIYIFKKIRKYTLFYSDGLNLFPDWPGADGLTGTLAMD